MRALGFLFAILLIVGIVGIWLGWFSFSKTQNGDRTQMELTVDREKISRDAERAKEKGSEVLQDLKESARELASDEVVVGNVTALDTTSRRMTVRTSGGTEFSLSISPKVDVRISDEVAVLESVRVGNGVRVFYEHENGSNVATRINVERQ